MPLFYNTFLRCMILWAIVVLALCACEDDDLIINAFEAKGTRLKYGVNHPTDNLDVAVMALECSRKKAENLDTMHHFIRDNVDMFPQTGLICFGETITGLYFETPDYIRGIAEPVPGPVTGGMSEWWREYGVYISFGLADERDNLLYNTRVVIDPQGAIQAVHRKSTLTSDDAKFGYTAMRNANTGKMKNFKLGLMICAHVNGSWLTRQYIKADVDVLLSAFASPIGLHNFNIISRRVGFWQIFPNRNGKEGNMEYSGLIYVFECGISFLNMLFHN